MRKNSIQFKITLWYTLALIAIVCLAMFSIRISTQVILRNAVRDYLYGVVEENSDDFYYLTAEEAEQATFEDSDVVIAYEGGSLVIDDDFMKMVSDVYSAIYTESGELIYGENPLSKGTQAIPFTTSKLWSMEYNEERYDLYDRKLSVPGLEEGIWLRGMVSQQRNVTQLNNIVRLTLYVLPFFILIAALIGALLAGRMLAPLRQLEETAQQIADGGDLKQRIEIGKGTDEVHTLANVFNEMVQRLDRTFEAEKQFTSDASHELRTPMSVIQAQSEYILEKDRTKKEYQEAFEVVARQSARMNNLINDMLDYTRMDQGNERYPLEQLDLSVVVGELCEELALVKEKNITLTCQAESNCIINGNRYLLERLLQNLISNAYRYGKQDGYIRVNLATAGGAYRLSVSDNGIGIPAEEKEKIFQRFYRADTSRSENGTGLGLSIVKKIAELHEANIDIESTVGEGSTFFIDFPKK